MNQVYMDQTSSPHQAERQHEHPGDQEKSGPRSQAREDGAQSSADHRGEHPHEPPTARSGGGGMLYAMRDILDSQLMTTDHRAIGRVADIALDWRESGDLALTALLTGPQALAGRISKHLRRLFAWVLRDRFEDRIPLDEVRAFGPSTVLRGTAERYAAGQSERWLARVLWRWIPGSGYSSVRELGGRKAPRRVLAARHDLHLEDVVGKAIYTGDGTRLGHVVEVVVAPGHVPVVLGLLFGSYGMLYRLRVLEPLSKQFHVNLHPCFVPWSAVASMDRRGFHLRAGAEGQVADEPPPE